MALLKLQTLLLVLLVALVSPSPLAQHNDSELLVNKRWYSIPLDEDTPVDHPRAWPPYGPRGAVRPVRYCFGDDESYRELHKDLFGGIGKWVPATRRSSLVFVPDEACAHVILGRCMCNAAGVRVDTLHIFVASEDFQGATRGYSRASEEHSHYNPPNNLRFPPRKTLAPPLDRFDREDKKRAVLMAHELGHVIGFEHENQRPDAPNFVFFDCEALSGYHAATRAVAQVYDEPKFTHDMSTDRRMELVCTDRELATKYFKRAYNYIPYPHSASSHWRTSQAFDYVSIMLYGSTPGSNKAAIKANRYAVMKWDPDHPTAPMEMVWRGGEPGYGRVGISAKDIERVSQLYPRMVLAAEDILDPQQQGRPRTQPRDTTSSKAEQSSYPVVISNAITTTIMPAPTDVPTSLSDPKVEELLSQYLKDCGDSDTCDEPEEIWLGKKRES